ncbi:MAG: pyruvate kinase, partial [Selenomonas massiliensis]
MLKRTKIICTQGPATDPDGIVDALIESGMNCARFNFSHGTHEEHLVRINKVRAAAERSGKVISLILDTKGPEMRLGEFKDGKVQLEKGKQFTLTYDDTPGDETHVSVNHKNLYNEVKPGDTLLLSDGLVGLVVDEVRGKDIVTTIQTSGPMSTRKRVAAPGVELGLPAISEQD